MQIYVIEWQFYDNSGSGVMPYVYTHADEAKRALHMLQEHGNRQYTLIEIKLLGV